MYNICNIRYYLQNIENYKNNSKNNRHEKYKNRFLNIMFKLHFYNTIKYLIIE